MCFKQSFPRTPIIQENLCFKTLGAAAMAGESETNKKHQFHCLLLRSFRQIQAGCIATNLSRYGDIPLKHTLKWQCLRMIDPNQLGCLICWRDLVSMLNFPSCGLFAALTSYMAIPTCHALHQTCSPQDPCDSWRPDPNTGPPINKKSHREFAFSPHFYQLYIYIINMGIIYIYKYIKTYFFFHIHLSTGKEVGTLSWRVLS